MKNKIYILLMLISHLNIAYGFENHVGLNLGLANLESESIKTFAVDYHILHKVLDSDFGSFFIGTGLRATRINADSFPIYKDLEFLENVYVTSLNAAFYSEYRYNKIRAGFNIDLIGSSFGEKSDVKNSSEKVAPNANNYLAGSTADEGTLNSEVWVGHDFDGYTLKIGSAHIVTHYNGENPIGKKRHRFFDSTFISLIFNI